jgi:hypothetical protein
VSSQDIQAEQAQREGATPRPESRCDTIVLKLQPLHTIDFWAGTCVGIGGLIAAFAVPGVVHRGWAILLPFFIATILVYSFANTRITVAGERVTVRESASSERTVNTSQIASIHRHSYWIVFRDADGKRLLRMRPGWTTGQLSDLAERVNAPYVDHVKGHGLRGRLLG